MDALLKPVGGGAALCVIAWTVAQFIAVDRMWGVLQDCTAQQQHVIEAYRAQQSPPVASACAQAAASGRIAGAIVGGW